MKKIIYAFLIMTQFVFCQVGIHAGQLQKPVPENFFSASPDVTAFQKYDYLPVNLYTGKVDISIPLYEVKSGDITVPITLNYNTGGIKIDEYASSTGMNWSLSAGGSIIRIVKDLPDNKISFSANVQSDWDLGVYIEPTCDAVGYNRKGGIPYRNSIYWSEYNRYATYVESPTENSNSIMQTSDITYDFSPDIFRVSAPGFQTSFISVNNSGNDIYPNNSSGFTTSFLDNSGAVMKSLTVDRRNVNGYGFPSLTETSTHYGRINHPIKDFFNFRIVSPSGLEYYFADEEVRESFYAPLGNQFPSDTFGAYNAKMSIMSNNYSKDITNWNITNITDYRHNRTVNFNYTTYGNPNNEVTNFVNAVTNINSTYVPLSNLCVFDVNPLQRDYFGSFINMQKNPKRKRLSQINFIEGTVDFNYNLSRQDYLGENALTSIYVRDVHETVIKRIDFVYEYFTTSENCNDPECKRLYLVGIDIIPTIGQDEPMHYRFEYLYDQKLPKRGSLQQDYLGFYNHNGVTAKSSTSIGVLKPQLFFYTDNGKYSLLPFPRTDIAANAILPGNFSLQPSLTSTIGLLKKIVYPSKGSLEIEYENNYFKFMGSTYLAGGARVKSQTLKENGVTVKKITYHYTEDDGSSSGYINNIPVYGYLTDFQLTGFVPRKFKVFDKPKGTLEMTSGSYVGYSRVIQREQGNGFKISEFTSPKDISNVSETRVPENGVGLNYPVMPSYECTCKYVLNSPYPSIAPIEYDYKRGMLVKDEIYNEQGDLLKSIENTYIDRTFSSLALSKDFKINQQYPSDMDFYPENKHVIGVSSSIPIGNQYLKQSQVSTDVLNNSATSTYETFSYNNWRPNLSSYTFNDGINQFKRNIYYPYDSEVSGSPFISNLTSLNIANEVIKEKEYKDEALIHTKNTNYKLFNNFPLPESLSTSKSNLAPMTDEIVDRRDDLGNIIEFHNSAGVYTSIIWGYKKTLPVAQLVNCKYSNINSQWITNIQSLSNLDDDTCVNGSNCTEESLRTALQNLRTNLPQAMVTYYTYNPLVGITSTTDPKGNSTYYEYDAFGRLITTRDGSGNLLSENKYNFRP